MLSTDGERIPEKKRRESDIKKMGEHKLKGILLRCIEDSSVDRPNAEEVSKWLQYEWSKIQQKQNIANYAHPAQVPKLKIAVLGQSAAGKSCLISRFLDHEFDERVMPTYGQVLRITNIKVHDKEYHLQIEDTAGQERFHSIISASIKHCQGVVLVFDLTDGRSLFEGIPEMVRLVKDQAPDSTSMILVGNKADLADAQRSKRKIRQEEAEHVAHELGIPYIETSALSGQNVERAFQLITDKIYDTLELSDIDIYIDSTSDNIRLTNEDVPRDQTFLQKINNCFRRLREWWQS